MLLSQESNTIRWWEKGRKLSDSMNPAKVHCVNEIVEENTSAFTEAQEGLSYSPFLWFWVQAKDHCSAGRYRAKYFVPLQGQEIFLGPVSQTNQCRDVLLLWRVGTPPASVSGKTTLLLVKEKKTISPYVWRRKLARIQRRGLLTLRMKEGYIFFNYKNAV